MERDMPLIKTESVIKLNPPAAVLGNGPSLRGADFAKELSCFDTFGMNAAYRHWDAIGWYPTYYSCLDEVVGLSHKDAIQRLIIRASSYGIRKFLLRANLVEALGDVGRLPYVTSLEAMQYFGNPFFLSRTWVTTGSHTVAWAAMLGYRDIILLGIDGQYVEIIKEAKKIDNAVLEMAETPRENPNYFFEGYQQAGDRYHIPNPTQDSGHESHILSWRTLRPQLEFSGTLVINANPLSRVDAFPKRPFNEALSAIAEMRSKQEQTRHDPGLSGIHEREDEASIDELRLFYPFFPDKNGNMIDVGAHHGGTCVRFLHRGWLVHAFEPDPDARAELLKNTSGLPGITVDSRAVSKVSGREYPWHKTPESTGASSMAAFTPGHVCAGTVATVTLSDYCAEQGIDALDFLKVDAEGFDYMVLQGFPFDRIRPRFILCEFEDRKTVPLGNTLHDMGHLLLDLGYHVFMSEWHPIVRYGIKHQWRRFVRYPSEPATPLAWGNLLAFAEKPDEETLRAAIQAQLQPQEKPACPTR